MEMHFVHTAQVDGVTKLAVVACFYEKGDRSPSFIKKLMRQALPKATADPAQVAPGLDFRVRATPSELPSPAPHAPLFFFFVCVCLSAGGARCVCMRMD